MFSVDTDIRKPDTGALHISRPSGSHAATSNATTATNSSPDILTPDGQYSPYIEPVSEGEDEDDPMTAVAKHEDKLIGVTPAQAAEAIAFRQQKLMETPQGLLSNDHDRLGQRKHESSHSQAHKLSIDPLATSSAFDQSFQLKLASIQRGPDEPNEEELELPGAQADAEIEFSRNWAAPPGQRVAVPVRIEPKVYFAAERTFLVCQLDSQKPTQIHHSSNGFTLAFSSEASRPRSSTLSRMI
jgi:hypothetical protein